MFFGEVFHSHSFAMNRKRTLTITGHQMVMTPMTPQNSIAKGSSTNRRMLQFFVGANGW